MPGRRPHGTGEDTPPPVGGEMAMGAPSPGRPLRSSGIGAPAADAEWLKVEEVAAILRLPLSTTYELVRTGRIPSLKLGKHRRIRREVVDGLGR